MTLGPVRNQCSWVVMGGFEANLGESLEKRNQITIWGNFSIIIRFTNRSEYCSISIRNRMIFELQRCVAV